MSILHNTLALHHRGHLYNFLIDILMFELSFTIVLLCMALCTVEKGEILHHISGLQIRVRIGKLVSSFLIQNICCGYSKEPSQ